MRKILAALSLTTLASCGVTSIQDDCYDLMRATSEYHNAMVDPQYRYYERAYNWGIYDELCEDVAPR